MHREQKILALWLKEQVNNVMTDVSEHEPSEDLLAEVMTLRQRVAELEYERQQQALIIDQIHDSVIATDLGGHITRWNKGAERLFGYTQEDMFGQHLSVLYAPTHHEFLENQVIAPLYKRGENALEVQMVKQWGEVFYAHLSLSLLRDEDNQPCGMIGYAMDITERKRAEDELHRTHDELEQRVQERMSELHEINQALQAEITERKRVEEALLRNEDALRQSQALFERIIDNMPAAIYVKDMDGRLLLANRYFAAILHMDKHHIPGKREEELFPQEFLPSWRMTDEHVLATGRPVELEQQLTHDDGPHTYMTVKFLIYDVLEVTASIGCISMDITRRKRAEEALRENEARYRAIVEDQTEMICRCRPDGTLTFVNDAYCRYFGKRYEELIRRNFLAFVPANERERIHKYLATFTQATPVQTMEHRVIDARGMTRWQQWTDHAIFDEEGTLVEFQSVGRDITERKWAEEEYHLLVEHSVQGLTIHQHNRIVFANPAAARILGYTVADLLAMSAAEVQAMIYETDRKMVAERIQARMEGTQAPQEYVFRAYRRDGSLRWLRAFVTAIAYRGHPAVQMTYIDVTEHILAEKALRQSQQRYERLLRLVTNYIYSVEVDAGHVVSTIHWPGCVNVTGYTAEEYTADPYLWYRMIHPDDRDMVVDHAERILAGEVVFPLEHRIQHKDDSIRWVRNTPAPIYDDQGYVVSYDGLVTDITHEKRYEMGKIALAAALAATGEARIESAEGTDGHDYGSIDTTIPDNDMDEG